MRIASKEHWAVKLLFVWNESIRDMHGSDIAEDRFDGHISEPKNCHIQGSFLILINQNKEYAHNLASK